MPRTSSGVTDALVDRVDDPAVVHDADPVGQVEHVVDVVADQEDPDALVLELADEAPDLRGLGRPERRGGLVHDQDPGVEVDGTRDRDGLALAAGEGLHGLGEVLEVGVEPAHHLAGLGLHGRVVEGADARSSSRGPGTGCRARRCCRRARASGRSSRCCRPWRRAGCGSSTGLPSMRISPVSAGWAPDRTRISVDLPAPLPPTRPMTSPAWRSIETSRTACTPPKATLMPRISTSGVRSVDRHGRVVLRLGHRPPRRRRRLKVSKPTARISTMPATTFWPGELTPMKLRP